MFCKNCGAENIDTAKFCCQCGSPFVTLQPKPVTPPSAPAQKVTNENPDPKQKAPKKSKKWIVIPIIAVAVIAIAVLAVVLLNKLTKGTESAPDNAKIFRFYTIISKDGYVYPFDGALFDYSDEARDAGEYLRFKDMYIEYRPDGNVTFSALGFGHVTMTEDEFEGALYDAGMSLELEDSSLYISSEMTFAFKQIQEDEVDIYNKILERIGTMEQEKFDLMVGRWFG